MSVGGDQFAVTCAHAVILMSVRRLPVATADRYLEEFQADLIELQRSSTQALLAHALGMASIAWRLNTTVAGSPSPPGRTWALRALAHLGLVPPQRCPEALCDAAYVFPPGGILRWRPRPQRGSVARAPSPRPV